ncbi:MAG TPA: ATP-binding cassette domain-containing protein [Thermoplasmata archaeon]|jgi:ABC-2 type transport system ATP-binding protein|nr:ATP-binding cassette domain-containing protein [Thermoplasmata archaeon]
MSGNGWAISAHGLTKHYDKLVAVDHVDLLVPSGSIFGLLGPNGAGKTTIIKVLTGLSGITDGSATVAGYDVVKDPMHVKQRVGWVAAEVILDDDLSGWENLWLQAKLQRLSEWKDRAARLLEYFELSDRRKDRVGTYSTGMRKKMEIALALLHQPEIIFMDEPTIGLDPNVRRMLWELITGVNKQFGVTVFLTSHYMEEADALCSQVAIIDHGKIVAFGTPSELKSRVKEDFVEIETSESVTMEKLEAIPGVSNVRSQGNAWILRVASAETVLPHIFHALQTDGIRRINVEKPSLESVFIDITGKRIDQAGSEVQDFRKFYMNLRRARR